MITPNPHKVLVYSPDAKLNATIGLFLITQNVVHVEVCTSEEEVSRLIKTEKITVALLHDPVNTSSVVDLKHFLREKFPHTRTRILPSQDGRLIEPAWQYVVDRAIAPRQKRQLRNLLPMEKRLKWRPSR